MNSISFVPLRFTCILRAPLSPPGRDRHFHWVDAWRIVYAVAVLVAFSVAGAAQAESTGSAAAEKSFHSRIEALLQDSDLSEGHIGVVFRDGDSGRALYSLNPDLPLKPASNIKLFTSAAALYFLGDDFRYQTLVTRRGPHRGNTLYGDLVVIGSGDPSISGRFVENHDRTAIFQCWADVLKQKGIERITGDVVGIDDAFDDVCQAPGWPEEDRGEWYCAEISALAYNDNCVDLRWEGTDGDNLEPAHFELIPSTGYVQVINFVTTSQDGGDYDRFYYRSERSNTITVRGRIGRGDQVFDSASVFNPTLYFTTVLTEVLRQKGIEVGGLPRDADEFEDKSVFQRSLEPVTVHESPPLADILTVINRNSHNFYAEQVFKTLGKRLQGEGSFEAGARSVLQYVEEVGLDQEGLTLVDGSGLSRQNRASANQISSVLLAVNATADGPLFRDTLPLGGRTGSLRHRFQSDDRLKKMAPRVRAKTGYIRGCHALSGWVETRAGQFICFSILCNDLPMTNSQTKLLIERLVALAADLDKKI